MSNERIPKPDRDQQVVYHIRVAGQLGRQWADWFEGLAITLDENGDTLLTGPVVDQAALHGLLKKVRDLGMPLLAVVCVQSSEAGALDVTSSALSESTQPGGGNA